MQNKLILSFFAPFLVDHFNSLRMETINTAAIIIIKIIAGIKLISIIKTPLFISLSVLSYKHLPLIYLYLQWLFHTFPYKLVQYHHDILHQDKPYYHQF